MHPCSGNLLLRAAAIFRAVIVSAGAAIVLGQTPSAFPHSGVISPAPPASPPTGSSAIPSGPTKPVELIDPVLRMKAYSWAIPAKWIFDGAIMQGSPCSAGASPIFRIMSPDGITEIKMLPRFDWTWSTLPKAPAQSSANANQNCAPFDKEVSANEFLKYMVGVLGVNYVKDLPTPGLAAMLENDKKQNAQAAARAPKGAAPFLTKSDMAAFLVHYNVNSIPVEENLSATTLCSDSPNVPPAGQKVVHFYTCNAWVVRQRTRDGQIEAIKPTFQAISKSMAIDPQWNQRWQQVMNQKIADMYAASTKAILAKGDENARMMQARHNAFQQGQEMRQRQHAQFMATMQRGTDMAMKRSQESTDARSRMAGDWADYALDQQKRRDPNTGEITKDSSQYSYTWVNESGQRFQTNDGNDNPNGRLSGNWTLQQNIR